MRTAKEAFLTGSSMRVMPLVEINGEPIGEGRVLGGAVLGWCQVELNLK